MISKKVSKIITLVLILSFPLTTTLVPISGAYQPSAYNLAALAAGNYFETFEDLIHYNPATSAWGWGSGTLTNQRDFFIEELDFYPTTLPVTGVAVQGRKAYLGCYSATSSLNSLIALNLFNVRDVRYMSHRDSSSGIWGIAAQK